MKRATALPAYSNLEEFPLPEGIAVLDIDPETLQLATPSCPMTRREVFIQGSAPTEFCERHGGVMLTETPPVSWLAHIFGGEEGKSEETGTTEVPAAATAVSAQPQPATPIPAAAAKPPVASRPRAAAPARPASPPKPVAPAQEEKKPGLLDRIFGIFGSSSDQQAPAK
jgi:hypothetical protein